MIVCSYFKNQPRISCGCTAVQSEASSKTAEREKLLRPQGPVQFLQVGSAEAECDAEPPDGHEDASSKDDFTLTRKCRSVLR